MITLNDGTIMYELPADAATAAKVVASSLWLSLSNYRHPLPALTRVGGRFDLEGYKHPLPALTRVGAWLNLSDYPHFLPELTEVGKGLYLANYKHPLPKLTTVGGGLHLVGYKHPLSALTTVGGQLDLCGYPHANWPWLIDGGTDRRGYYFTGVLHNGEWRIRAGCRDYSFADALAHWGRGGESNRPDCVALVEKIIAEAQRRKAK